MTDQIQPAIRVARGATYLYAQGIIGNLVAVVYFAYAARVLSQTEIGVLATLNLIGTLVMFTATLALPAAATKYIAEYAGKGELQRSKKVYRFTTLFGIASGAGFAAITIAMSGVFSTTILGGQANQLTVVLLGIDMFPLILSQFFTGTLTGLQKFREMAIATALQMITRSTLAVLFLAAGQGLQGVVLAWIIGDITGLSLKAALTIRAFAKTQTSDDIHGSVLFKYSAPLYVSNLVTYFANQTDKYLVLFFLAPQLGTEETLAQLGIYNLATVAVSVVGMVLSSLGTTLFPQLSERLGKDGKDAVDQASQMASRYVSIAFVPMAVGLAAVAHPTITLFVGPSYGPGSTALAIVSLATAVTCLAPLVNSVLLSLGSTRVILEGSIISIAGAVVAGFPLVRSAGINGAALTRAALLILGFSYVAYRLAKVHGLHIDRNALGKSCVASAAMALVVISFELLLQNRYLLPIYIVVGAAVYLLAVKALHVLQPADIDLIINFLPPPLRGVASKIGAFLVRRA